MKSKALMFMLLFVVGILTNTVIAAPRIFKPGARNNQMFGIGWDVYNGLVTNPESLRMGRVIFNSPMGETNLEITVMLKEALPFKEYLVGLVVFDKTERLLPSYTLLYDVSTPPEPWYTAAPASFGAISQSHYSTWVKDGYDPELGIPARFRVTGGVYELGIITTNEFGDGVFHINLHADTGVYPTQFWLSWNPESVEDDGVRFNTGAYFGDYFLLEIS